MLKWAAIFSTVRSSWKCWSMYEIILYSVVKSECVRGVVLLQDVLYYLAYEGADDDEL